MAQATSTTLGEIKLAGDLAGSTNALAPELTATGVTAGSYPLPKLTIDAKGRVLTAASSSSADILALIPDATYTGKGVVQIGNNINIAGANTSGKQTIFFNPGVTTGELINFCTNAVNYTVSVIVDGNKISNISISGGSIPAISDFITAFNTQLVGATIAIDNGNLTISSSLSGSTSNINVTFDNMFRFMPGFTVIGTPTAGSGLSTIYVNDASASQKGVVRIGSGLSVSNGLVSFDPSTVNPATVNTAGLVRIGSGLTMTGNLISANFIPDATANNKGLVQIGSGINVTAGVISIPDASYTVKGLVTIGTGLVLNNGVVNVDTSVLATSSTAGLVQIGSGLTSTGGVVSVNSIASSSSLGLVKIGAGVTIDGSGVISTSAGTIADATTSSKGIVQIGSGLAVNNGVISLNSSAYATSSSVGAVQISTVNALTIANGIVDVSIGTNSTLGVVKSNNTNNITITNGAIDVGVNIAKLDTANTYIKAQVVALSTLSCATTVTPDFSSSNTFYMDATSNFTLNAPTNIVAGGTYYIIVKQDATGGRLITWNSAFKFRGVTPSLSTLSGKYDVISIIAQSSSSLLTEVLKGYA
jgi:hypothetical protein